MIEAKDNTPEVQKIIDRMANAIKELTDQLGCDFGVISVDSNSYLARFSAFDVIHGEIEERLSFEKKWGEVE